MNESKRNQIHRYFQLAMAECQAQIAALQADHRADEAVFVKIRLNVFDIFHTVFSAGEKAVGEDDDKLAVFFRERLNQIPQNWKAAQEKAQQHENTEKTHIENIKLDTAAQIGEVFCRIWEEKL